MNEPKVAKVRKYWIGSSSTAAFATEEEGGQAEQVQCREPICAKWSAASNVIDQSPSQATSTVASEQQRQQQQQGRRAAAIAAVTARTAGTRPAVSKPAP